MSFNSSLRISINILNHQIKILNENVNDELNPYLKWR